MTELDFHRDPYQREFDAQVVARKNDGSILLDRTCFYPGGGGQPCDLGSLSWGDRNAAVVGVRRSELGILHHVDPVLPAVGDTVHGVLDWERRYRLMRTHTALHILCGVIWRDHRKRSTGCDMKPGAAHIDFELETVDVDLRVELERAVNVEIEAARPIVVGARDRVEGDQIEDLLRTKVNLLPEDLARLRIVEIVGLDLQADGGTHVANTSEVGGVRIVRCKNKGRENKRLYVELS